MIGTARWFAGLRRTARNGTARWLAGRAHRARDRHQRRVVYDPGTNLWSTAAPYPGASVDHPGAACVGGKVYLIGGLVHVGSAVKTVYQYDPATNAWTQKADLPQPRGAMGVAVYNGKVYAVGGLGYPAKADLFAYDPAANTWQALAPMLTPRDHLVMEEVGGKLYAIGGRNVTLGTVTAANETYDPTTNTWSARAPMPVARAGMASAICTATSRCGGAKARRVHTRKATTTTRAPIPGTSSPASRRHGTAPTRRSSATRRTFPAADRRRATR